MNSLSGLLISIVLIFILWYLSEHLFREGNRSIKAVFAGYAALVICDYMLYLLSGSFIVRAVVMAVLSLGFELFMYRDRIWKITCTVLVFYGAFTGISEGGRVLLNICGGQIDPLFKMDYGYLMYYSFVLTLLLFAVQVFLVSSGHIFRKVQTVQMLPQIIIVIICLILQILTLMITDWRSRTLELALINMLLMCTGIVVCAYLEILKGFFESRERIRLTEGQLEMQKNYYKNVLDYQEETRKLWHDIGKYTSAVNALVEGSDAKEAEKARLEMNEHIKGIDQVADVNNQVINSILTYGIRKCNDAGIRLEIKAWVAEELAISATDLFVIIGNTLDNAVEACTDLEDKERTIRLSLIQKNHVLLYEINNRIPENTKPKKGSIHGYGLKNVEQCVRKNGGIMIINQENGEFSVSIHLNV